MGDCELRCKIKGCSKKKKINIFSLKLRAHHQRMSAQRCFVFILNLSCNGKKQTVSSASKRFNNFFCQFLISY